MHDTYPVSVDPVFNSAVLVVEQVLLHLLGSLGLGLESVGADTGVVDQYANALFLLGNLVGDARNIFL